MIPGSANPLLLATAAGAGEYEISRSLRFNSSDSAYLSRTPSTAGNRKTWTWAAWVKRSGLGRVNLFNSYSGSLSESTYTNLQLGTGDNLIFGSAFVNYRTTTQVFRDASAWYHIVVTVDTTQSTANNRVRIYVNGEELTQFSTTNNPSQNADLAVNAAFAHRLGSEVNQFYFNGYLASVHLIDGQALDPTSFGEFDDNGIWQPKAYTGSYGTNGFHLDFSDNSTAAALGTDTSGNGNTWTVNNISVAAGAGNDSLIDVPTNGTQTDTGLGGEVRGNYATLNPLHGVGQTLTNGNLDASINSGSGAWVASTSAPSSGKWYCEATITDSNSKLVGILQMPYSLTARPYLNAFGYMYANTGLKWNNNISASYGASYTTNDVIGIAFDLDAGTLTFYKNGLSQGTAYTGLTGAFCPVLSDQSGGSTITATFNFGQRPFAYTAPSGFKALCTANLPTPTIADGSTAMDVVLDTGANILTAAQAAIGGSADLLWIKDRANTNNHQLIDTVRGGTATLQSNTTSAETTYSAPSGNSVAWTWDAGSSTVTNTQGSITSQVRANASAGFSIVTYTGNGSAGATIGHGLGVAPQMIIVKNRDAADAWQVYHSANTANPETDYLVLNTTAATADALDRWNDTAPTSTVFSLGDGVEVNTNTEDYVAYCWTGLVGYSSFGSYTGNGSADGPFVFTGMRPRYVLIKRTDSTSYWHIYDSARNIYNVANSNLWANGSDAEISNAAYNVDILSNGFKLRTSDATRNASAGTYIYAAFAESPMALNNRAR